MKGIPVMPRFDNVLCPIDLSETSSRALTYAAVPARWYDAHLEVLHSAVLVLNAIIGFTQERRAEQSVRALMGVMALRARVSHHHRYRV